MYCCVVRVFVSTCTYHIGQLIESHCCLSMFFRIRNFVSYLFYTFNFFANLHFSQQCIVSKSALSTICLFAIFHASSASLFCPAYLKELNSHPSDRSLYTLLSKIFRQVLFLAQCWREGIVTYHVCCMGWQDLNINCCKKQSKQKCI